MICQVEQSGSNYQNSLEVCDGAYQHWEWCFESEIKYLKKYASGGFLRIEDIDEMKDTIDQLKDDSKSFEYQGLTYDFSNDVDDLLKSL